LLLLLRAELASSSSAEPPRQPSRSRIAFLGTGASSSLPDLRCVVAGATSGDCDVCTRASGGADDPNFRGNVCMLLTIVDGDGRSRQILLDCGKTFRAAALRFFARLGVDGVDAILITHDHADALLGLDDIRSVQRYDPVQRLVLDPTAVFCDRRTFAHCERAFPYLMPRRETYDAAAAPAVKRFVSNLDWRPFDDHASFNVCGLRFTSLPVEHGADYLCTGYAWGPDAAKCVVLSDYTAVGPEVYAKLRHWSTGGRRIALLVLDVLARDNPPRVHASLEQSLALARELRPVATRFVGMSHGLEHGATNEELRALRDTEGLDCQLAHDGLEMHAEF
jgi:phosphoribosyl 1,2-cyclic phosphodiesterase